MSSVEVLCRFLESRPHLKRTATVLYGGWQLFLRDFHVRYRRTYLGIFWAWLNVLLMAAPFILVGRQFGFAGGHRTGVPYELYSLIGIMVWMVFWESVVTPQRLARRSRKLLRDVPIPHTCILVASGGYVFFNLTQYGIVTALFLAIFRVDPSWTILIAIPAMAVLFLAGLSLGMFFVPVTFVFLDVRYGLPLISTFLLWTAPIFYATPADGFLHALNRWNPLTYIVGIPRHWLVGGLSGQEVWFLLALVPFAVLFWVGLRFFNRAMFLAVERV